MNNSDSKKAPNFRIRGDVGRRDFLRHTLGSFAVVSTGAMTFGCGGNDATAVKP